MTSQKRPEAKDVTNSRRLGKLDRRRLCPGVPGSSSGCVSSGSLGRGRGCHQSSRCEQVLLGSQPSTAITPPRPLQLGTLQVFVTLCSGFSSVQFVRTPRCPRNLAYCSTPRATQLQLRKRHHFGSPARQEQQLSSAQLRFAALLVASESGVQTSSLTTQGSLHCLRD